MKAAPDTVVKITYELRTEPGGEIVDFADQDSPLTFLCGHQQLLEKFEQNIEGLEEGETFEFNLSPSEGYGEYDEDALITLDRELFGGPDQYGHLLVEGNMIPLRDEQGNQYEGRIASINDTSVVVDMNHPLAGKTLYFTGVILSVRAADPAEIAHGHIHEGNEH
ncbi:MAG: peptidyl-prolyl cis-trans isomerase [Chitinophagales bacterium]|nr:MAG: peptidyl-prolyl cis-trans isomerase [Chitinophagales bacterium]